MKSEMEVLDLEGRITIKMNPNKKDLELYQNLQSKGVLNHIYSNLNNE